MPKKIKLYDKGDCVEVATWVNDETDGFFVPGKFIGLILEAELVEMDGESGMFESTTEWMYRVILPDGRVTEAWDYEIRPVNVMGKEYNTVSHKPKGE